jgi:peptidoglycan hydrolase-like protein with peptidoglycan-binding domain
VRSDFPDYRPLAPGSRGVQVQALQCLLRQKHAYDGPVHGRFDGRTTRAVRSFEGAHGLPVDGRVTGRTWTVLLSEGSAPLLKVGSAGDAVRRLQRALNVATDADLRVTGVFTGPTERWVRAYQRQRGLPATGVVTGSVWDELLQGHR